MAKTNYPWQGKVTNHAQIGGIELATLENGPGRGTRIANVNTGTGLRYKIVIDRACDISEAFFNQHSLCWHSHGGVTAPSPDKKPGLEWLYSFFGGLVATCGLSHMGAPTDKEGLHGRIGNQPAELVSVIQPDIAAGKLDMSITAIIKESKVFGPSLELKRTISSTLGKSTIKICDVVTNRANTPSLLKLLYHCNFGWPLVDEGADFIYNGKCTSYNRDCDNNIFNKKHNYKKITAPLDIHRGSGESCAYIDIKPDRNGVCTTGIVNKKLGLSAMIKYNKKQLPYLTNWQHFGPGEYVTALEPATNLPFDQGEKKVFLTPGQSKTFELEFEVENK
jgi:hypothetical protein